MIYFFDIFEPAGDFRDTMGVPFSSFDAMRLEAKRALARIAEEQPETASLTVSVRNEDNVEVYRLLLTFQEQIGRH